MTIKDNIRQRRIEKGLTLEELGKAVGVSKQTIQRYETGQITTIPYDKILLLATALSVTPQALMGWDSPEQTSHKSSKFEPLSSAERDMLSDYRVLNDTGQQEATKRVHELTLIPSYVEVRFLGHQKEDNDIIPLAAHHAPGVTGAEDEAVDEVERLRRKYEKED